MVLCAVWNAIDDAEGSRKRDKDTAKKPRELEPDMIGEDAGLAVAEERRDVELRNLNIYCWPASRLSKVTIYNRKGTILPILLFLV